MLNCPQCGHDNDIGRIFCAKCGQKLEISRVGVPSSVRRGSRRSKQEASIAQRVLFGIRKFIQIALLAAAAALVASIWIPPRDASRAPGDKDLEAFQKKRAELEEAFGNQTGGQFMFREEELNAKLAEAVAVTRKAAGENAGGMQIEKLTVALGEGTATITVTQKWKWFRLGVQAVARLKNNDARWFFDPVEIRVGRWLAPALITPHLVPILERLLSGLAPEKQKLEQAASVEIKPGELILAAPKPSGAVP